MRTWPIERGIELPEPRRWRVSDRTFFVYYGPAEWYGRIAGRGLGLRDHRNCRPLASERYRAIKGNHYLHLGPFCLAVFLRPPRAGHA